LRRKILEPDAVHDPSGIGLAGHVALAMLNTVVLEAGQKRDLFERDADVLKWLDRLGLPSRSASRLTAGSLLKAARNLRESLRACIIQRKSGRPVNLDPLNAFLANTCGHSRVLREGNVYRVDHVWAGPGVEALLAPVADAAAQLLTVDDFALVRRCESEDCILWFLDTTKAHRRRWCSMATCGNRAKAAAFRARSAR
jgi:predicted RNA-binding Zn ribbon-like protein